MKSLLLLCWVCLLLSLSGPRIFLCCLLCPWPAVWPTQAARKGCHCPAFACCLFLLPAKHAGTLDPAFKGFPNLSRSCFPNLNFHVTSNSSLPPNIILVFCPYILLPDLWLSSPVHSSPDGFPFLFFSYPSFIYSTITTLVVTHSPKASQETFIKKTKFTLDLHFCLLNCALGLDM